MPEKALRGADRMAGVRAVTAQGSNVWLRLLSCKAVCRLLGGRLCRRTVIEDGVSHRCHWALQGLDSQKMLHCWRAVAGRKAALECQFPVGTCQPTAGNCKPPSKARGHLRINCRRLITTCRWLHFELGALHDRFRFRCVLSFFVGGRPLSAPVAVS